MRRSLRARPKAPAITTWLMWLVWIPLGFGAFALFIGGFASRESAGILVLLALTGVLVGYLRPGWRARRRQPPPGNPAEE